MAAPVNFTAYNDALLVLGTAGVIMPVMRRIGISPIIGYLATGAALGPLGIGVFVESLPWLKWFTVTEARNVDLFAEFGIIFLLFLIGLEMTFERLKAMRRLILGLGGSQWLVTSAAIGGSAWLMGYSVFAAMILGGCLALSSTAIVIELLSGQNRLSTNVGRISFAILLAQDLAIVPLLIFIAIAGANMDGNILQTLGLAILQAAIALASIVLIGRIVLRPLFRLVGETQSGELFIAAIMFVIVGTGVIAASAGLSMALGAFVAGLLLAETEYRKGIEAIVHPFKGLLLGIFFFSVGMLIDVRILLAQPVAILGTMLALLMLKSLIVMSLVRWGGLSWPITIETALLLAPGGELAIVGLTAAQSSGIIDAGLISFLLAATAMSMALTPLLGWIARSSIDSLVRPVPPDPETTVKPTPEMRHAIVIGHGRVGLVVCSMLQRHAIPYIATDMDARSVAADRRRGHKVFFGDATDPAFLDLCNIRDAAALIITIHSPSVIERMVRVARSLRADIPIISRARDADHASRLYRIGVNDAVPETIEASLQLSEAALINIGVPTGFVIASVHEKRDEFRAELLAAAQNVGLSETHSVRKKTAG